MTPLALSITDQDLQQKIQTSVLTEEQKRELVALLPQMTEGERQEINQLIDDSVRDLIAADPELQKRVTALNEEYSQKLHELVRQESRRVREGFEQMEKTTELSDMQAVEGELGQATEISVSAPVQTTIQKPKRKHPILKGIVVLGLLAALAAGILWAFQFLR